MATIKLSIRKPFDVRLSTSMLKQNTELYTNYLRGKKRICDITAREHNTFLNSLLGSGLYGDIESYILTHPDRNYVSFLDLACSVGEFCIIKIILKRISSIQSRNAVDAAFASGHIDIARMLIEKNFPFSQGTLIRTLFNNRSTELAAYLDVSNIKDVNIIIVNNFMNINDKDLAEFLAYLQLSSNFVIQDNLFRVLVANNRYYSLSLVKPDILRTASFTLWKIVKEEGFCCISFLEYCLRNNIFLPLETNKKELSYLITRGRLDLARILEGHDIERVFHVAIYRHYRQYYQTRPDEILRYLEEHKYRIVGDISELSL